MDSVGFVVTSTTPEPWHRSQLSEDTEVSFLHSALTALEIGVRRVHLVRDVVAGSEKARSPGGFLACLAVEVFVELCERLERGFVLSA